MAEGGFTQGGSSGRWRKVGSVRFWTVFRKFRGRMFRGVEETRFLVGFGMFLVSVEEGGRREDVPEGGGR